MKKIMESREGDLGTCTSFVVGDGEKQRDLKRLTWLTLPGSVCYVCIVSSWVIGSLFMGLAGPM